MISRNLGWLFKNRKKEMSQKGFTPKKFATAGKPNIL